MSAIFLSISCGAYQIVFCRTQKKYLSNMVSTVILKRGELMKFLYYLQKWKYSILLKGINTLQEIRKLRKRWYPFTYFFEEINFGIIMCSSKMMLNVFLPELSCLQFNNQIIWSYLTYNFIVVYFRCKVKNLNVPMSETLIYFF